MEYGADHVLTYYGCIDSYSIHIYLPYLVQPPPPKASVADMGRRCSRSVQSASERRGEHTHAISLWVSRRYRCPDDGDVLWWGTGVIDFTTV